MQQDLFIEKIVKRKCRATEIVYSIMLIISAIILIFLCFYIPILMQKNFFFMSVIISFGIGYVGYRLIANLRLEYEYCIANDELTIDKIIAQKKRVNVFKGSCKDFSVFAPASGLGAETFLQKNLRHLDLRSGQDHGCDWYFITKSNPPILVLFEPDERFINSVKRFNPRSLLGG